ncbi:MAG: hypothetical protein M1831_007047 [Alyxoria varia]|nr:MAG: hypothetical protein M1831_007047 [Alyxoria varia]
MPPLKKSGPNFIHSSSPNNPITKLAHATHTRLHTWAQKQSLYAQDGAQVPDDIAAEVSEAFWGIMGDAFAYSRECNGEIGVERSLMDFVVERARERFPDGEDGGTGGHGGVGGGGGGGGNGNGGENGGGVDTGTAYADRGSNGNGPALSKRKLLLQEAEAWGGYVGGATSKQSLKMLYLEESIEGENPFVASTYSKILAKIAEPALQKGRVLFGHAVNRVTTTSPNGSGHHEVTKASTTATESEHGGDERGRSSGAAVVVRAENGFSESFDDVVVTAPLGYLKRNMEGLFDPPLPGDLARAIEDMGYGTLDKVYITFPAAFWEPQQPQQQRPPQTSSTTTTTTTTNDEQPSDNPDDQISSMPGFTLFTSPTYAPNTNPHRWPQHAVNLAAIPSPDSQPTLQFFIFGDCASHIARLVSDTSSVPAEASTASHASISTTTTDAVGTNEETHDRTTEALIEFFEPYFSRLPGYNRDSLSCRPTAALATAWAADEYAGHGSYTNWTVGCEHGDKDVERVRRGVPERGLWFAGEHTAPFEGLGTVTGAWWAGDGVAKRILMERAV